MVRRIPVSLPSGGVSKTDPGLYDAALKQVDGAVGELMGEKPPAEK